MVNVSNELEWLLIRDSATYTVKQPALRRFFSREKGNPTQLHSPKYSSTTNPKTILITLGSDGLVVGTRKSDAAFGAIKGAYSSKSGVSKGEVYKLAAAQGVGRPLSKVAAKRATALARSQRTRKPAKTREPRGKKERKAAALQAAKDADKAASAEEAQA